MICVSEYIKLTVNMHEAEGVSVKRKSALVAVQVTELKIGCLKGMT